ncbi:MAG: phosphatase PAP2-related protein [Deltaproteobacteria bacterium]
MHVESIDAVMSWREALAAPAAKRRWAVTALLIVFAAVSFSTFVQWVEGRPGAVLEDPVLPYLPRADLTWFTFAMVYAITIAAVLRALKRPLLLMRILQVYAGMLLIRIVAMYLLPLDPPADAIPLADPVAAILFASESAPTRDLFFSGHTATACVVLFTTKDRRWIVVFALAALVIATAVLVQRVHYTIDVFGAPFFVWAVCSVLNAAAKKN